jgi:NADPH:quinone reductase-like Zn-dependent oxidoreductase
VRGRFVTNAAQWKDYFAKIFNYKKVILGVSSDADLKTINKLVEKGALKSIIDTTYSFNQMQEAHAKTDSGRKVGNVVVNMLSSNE